MIDIARNIVPCSDKQDMKSRNGSYFQPSFSTRKRQRISSDLFSELPQKRSKTTNGRIWNKTTYSFSSQTLCTISSKVIRMWASFHIFVSTICFNVSLFPRSRSITHPGKRRPTYKRSGYLIRRYSSNAQPPYSRIYSSSRLVT